MARRQKWLGSDDFDKDPLTQQARDAFLQGEAHISVEFERAPGAELTNSQRDLDAVLRHKIQAIERIGWSVIYVDYKSETHIKITFFRAQ